MAELNEVIVGLLQAGQPVELRAGGVSMLPLLWPRMRLHTEPCDNFRRGDIAVYISNNGKLIAHRIVQIKEENILLQGDSCLKPDTIVAPKQIVGIVTKVHIGNKTLSVSGRIGQLYSHLVLLTSPVSHIGNHILAIIVSEILVLRGIIKK